MVKIRSKSDQKERFTDMETVRKSKVRRINTGPLIQEEKDTVEKMIRIYCKKKHHQQDLCDDCQELLNYSHKRLSLCPFGEKKGACSNCHIHCYKPEYRDKIKTVMRYSGKWMFFYHPIYSIKHLLSKVSDE